MTNSEIQAEIEKHKAEIARLEAEMLVFPKLCHKYFFVCADGIARKGNWQFDLIDTDRLAFGNCFRTEAEAQAVSDKIKRLLHGEGDGWVKTGDRLPTLKDSSVPDCYLLVWDSRSDIPDTWTLDKFLRNTNIATHWKPIRKPEEIA